MIVVFIFRGPEELHQQKQSKFMPQKTPAGTIAIVCTNTTFYILKANSNTFVIFFSVSVLRYSSKSSGFLFFNLFIYFLC